jgi:chromosome condensin MukBEF complex kleisin-like MukF subunit
MEFEVKFNSEEFMETLAKEVIKQEKTYWDESNAEFLIYHKNVSEAVYDAIKEIAIRSKEKIIEMVVDRLAEKYMTHIKLAAVLAGLSKKEDT